MALQISPKDINIYIKRIYFSILYFFEEDNSISLSMEHSVKNIISDFENVKCMKVNRTEFNTFFQRFNKNCCIYDVLILGFDKIYCVSANDIFSSGYECFNFLNVINTFPFHKRIKPLPFKVIERYNFLKQIDLKPEFKNNSNNCLMKGNKHLERKFATNLVPSSFYN